MNGPALLNRIRTALLGRVYGVPILLPIMLAGSFFIGSCSSDVPTDEVSIPLDQVQTPSDLPSELIRISKVIGNESSFGSVKAILSLGDDLFVIDTHLQPHIIYLPDGDVDKLVRFGTNGDGPGEFRAPRAFLRDQYNELWVYDFELRRITRITRDGIPDTTLGTPLSFNVDRSLLDPHWTTHQTIVSNQLHSDTLLIEIDPRSGEVLDSSVHQPVVETTHPTAQRLANRTFLSTTSDMAHIALAFQFGNRIDVTHYGFGDIRHIRGPVHTEPRYAINDSRFLWLPGNEMAYWAIDVTNDLIFGLFCGCPLEDRMTDASYPWRVHVFAWDGSFVREIVLDRPLTAFDVSDDGSILYGAYLTDVGTPLLGEWYLD